MHHYKFFYCIKPTFASKYKKISVVYFTAVSSQKSKAFLSKVVEYFTNLLSGFPFQSQRSETFVTVCCTCPNRNLTIFCNRRELDL